MGSGWGPKQESEGGVYIKIIKGVIYAINCYYLAVVILLMLAVTRALSDVVVVHQLFPKGFHVHNTKASKPSWRTSCSAIAKSREESISIDSLLGTST